MKVMQLIGTLLILLGFSCNQSGNQVQQHNEKVRMQQNIIHSWNNLETQYRRKHDLIYTLTSADIPESGRKSYEELASVARSVPFTLVQDFTDLEEMSQKANSFFRHEKRLDSVLTVLVDQVMSNPGQANQLYRDIVIQLEGMENRIKFAKDDLNSRISQYNTAYPGERLDIDPF